MNCCVTSQPLELQQYSHVESMARMLRELGFLTHVFCWFYDVCLRVVASIRFLPSWLRFSWFYSVPQNKSWVNTSIWCWPLFDSAVIRKKPLLWIPLWQTVRFVPYRFSSAHFPVQMNPHTNLLNRSTLFNNSWIRSTSGNRCSVQVLQFWGRYWPVSYRFFDTV
jgi:hypothetical protein